MINKILNTFGTRVVSAILNLLIAVIISRFLGPEGKGQQGLIIATIAYVLVFANLMGGGAIIYLVPRFSYYRILVPAYLWTVTTGVLFYLVLSVFRLVDPSMIGHICVLAIISAFTAINASILIGKEKIIPSNLIAFVQPLIITLSLGILFFVFHEDSIQSYILSLYLSFGAAFLISLLYLNKYTNKFHFVAPSNYWPVILKLVKYGFLNQLAHIFQLLSFRMSYYWLEQVYSESEVGIYSNGTSLVESIWLISRSISLVQYARIANTDDKLYSQKLTINLTVAGLVVSFFVLLVLVLLPDSVYTFVYGPGFGEVGIVIRSLAPGVLLFNIALIVGHYFSGTGKYHVNTISSFAGLVVAIILFNFMIPSMGIIGAGIATSISYALTSIIVILFFVAESKIRLKDALPGKAEIKDILQSLLRRSSKK